MINVIHKLMERETAGDPISGMKWTRKSTEQIARQLKPVGDCRRPQHGRTVAPANEVFPAYQPQDGFRRFYF